MNAQPGRIVPAISVQPDKIDYSGTTRVTLAVEGPAPLRIDVPAVPEKFLAPHSSAIWQIIPLGPPKTQSLEGGRERWEQSFRLSPFAHGERVSLAFAPLRVNGQDVPFEAQTIRVIKTIEASKPEDAVPVTGIESLPSLPPGPSDESGWPFVAVLAGAFAIAVAIAIVRRARAVPPPIPPAEWAERELDRLDRDSALDRIDARTASERFAAILREFVERRFGLPASRLTTAELRRACAAAEWRAEIADWLLEALDRCDRAKFAGLLPDSSELATQIGAARQWCHACQGLRQALGE